MAMTLIATAPTFHSSGRTLVMTCGDTGISFYLSSLLDWEKTLLEVFDSEVLTLGNYKVKLDLSLPVEVTDAKINNILCTLARSYRLESVIRTTTYFKQPNTGVYTLQYLHEFTFKDVDLVNLVKGT